MAKLTGNHSGIPQYVALMKEYAQHQEYVLGLINATVYKSMLILQHFGHYLLDTDGVIPPVREITKTHIISYMVFASDGRKRNTVIRHLIALRGFFKYLEMTGEVANNPVETVKPKSHPTMNGDSLSIDEIDKLIDSFNNTTIFDVRNAAITMTLYSTGIRVSELCDLMLRDYLPDQGCIHVMGKGRVERMTPIGKNAIAFVGAYLIRRKEIARYRRKKQFLFVSQRGKRLTRVDVHAILVTQSKLAGIKHTSPHMLRRTFATHMSKAGAPVIYVQKLLGHK